MVPAASTTGLSTWWTPVAMGAPMSRNTDWPGTASRRSGTWPEAVSGGTTKATLVGDANAARTVSSPMRTCGRATASTSRPVSARRTRPPATAR